MNTFTKISERGIPTLFYILDKPINGVVGRFINWDRDKFIDPLINIGIFDSYHDIGEGCGYVIINKDHPLYKDSIPKGDFLDDYDIDVHGGITYYKVMPNNIHILAELSGKPEDYVVIGFDTKHVDDNSINCDKTFVENETKKLQSILENII